MNPWSQGEALSMFVLSVLNTTSNKGVLEGFLIVLSFQKLLRIGTKWYQMRITNYMCTLYVE